MFVLIANAFLMEIPNLVMKFNDLEIFDNVVTQLVVLSTMLLS